MRALPRPSSLRNLFPRTATLRLSLIKEMELRAAQIPGIVSLAQGIPSFDTPEPIGRYVQEKIASGACSRYSLTPGLPKLREAIAEALVREGMRYDPENEIVVTCGSIEAISATLLAVLEPGDEVLVPSPSYPSYVEVIRMAGGSPRFVPLVEEENFALDLDALEHAVTRRTVAVLFCNPNNPTGTVYSRAQLERLVEIAERRDLLLVVDEVYKDFLYNDAELFTPARIEAARGRVVRVFSFSKAYGMTGWRIGFLHSDRHNVAEILKVHDALVTCAPVVSQYAALAALELGHATVQAFRREFLERRNLTLGHLDQLSHIFDYQKPSASYFVFPRVKDTVPLARDSRRLARDILERGRVALVPGIAFGPSGEAHLRISYSRRRDEITEAFARLADYFHGGTRKPVPAKTADPDRLPLAAQPAAPSGPPSWRRSNLFPRARLAAITYLGWLARRYLARVRPRCVAIAGLQGKTVMKRWLRGMLEPTLRVRANPRSYNTELGLPLAILDTSVDSSTLFAAVAAIGRTTAHGLLDARPLDVLILEMGLRHEGDAQTLSAAVMPDVLVLTPLAPSFSNDLSFLDTVEREVAWLAQRVSARGGTVILCGDDPRLVAAIDPALPRVRTYRRDQTRYEPHGLRLEVQGDSFAVGVDVVGDSALYALLAGIEVARALGVEDEAIRRSLAGR